MAENDYPIIVICAMEVLIVHHMVFHAKYIAERTVMGNGVPTDAFRNINPHFY